MSATRQRHMEATRAPRRRHVGAAVSGPPAVAGGERRRPNNRGWARWKEETEGNLMVVAPLIIGRRSYGGEYKRRRPEYGEDENDDSMRDCKRGGDGEEATLTVVAERRS